MIRYFAQIQYLGTNYSGWQFQPNAITIQQVLEFQLNKLLRKETKIMGCGRTDSGVHASMFYFHFDHEDILENQFLFKLNLMLPVDIVAVEIRNVNDDAHARFDAISRSYKYFIHRHKNPFNQGQSYYYPFLFKNDLAKLNEVAQLLLEYKDFFPFCKSNTDVKTTICDLTESFWDISDDQLVYSISADRFLRGMVRLIVGCCINVALGKITINDVKNAIEKGQRLKKDLSVPAEGLFLTNVSYPTSIYKVGIDPYIY